jgi:hypothetical protein
MFSLNAASARDTSAIREDELTFLLDCNTFRCDSDYVRTETGFVNWVRNRTRVQVHQTGSFRIATAPEPNSSRLTGFKATCCDSPASNVGPWPASLGCTTNSYSSINPSSANASGSCTPPTNSPFPDSCLSR